MFIDKVSNCKYLGHCINDKLNDDDDMARQRKQIICPGKQSKYPCSSHTAPRCTPVRCGAIIAVNLYENYVLRTTMFLEK